MLHGLLRGVLHLRSSCCCSVNGSLLCRLFLGIEHLTYGSSGLVSGFCSLCSGRCGLRLCRVCAALSLCHLCLCRVRNRFAASLCHRSSCLAALTLHLSLNCLCACLSSEAHHCCHQSGSSHNPFHRFYLSFVALSGVFRPLKYRLCNKRQAVVGLIKHNIPRPSLRSCACRLRKNRRFLNPILLYYTRLH